MKDYVLLFRGGLDFTKAQPQEVQEVILKWKSWVEDLAKKGVYNGGERLTRNDATVVSGYAKQVFSGAYKDGGEIVGGYISMKADNIEGAVELAKGCPIFNFDGVVEIREVAKM